MRMAMTGIDGQPPAARTALVLDVDAFTARATMLGRVEDQFRFVAGSATPSSALPPIDDVSVAAKQTIRVVEEQLGTHLVGPDGVEVPGSTEHGVDVFALTGQPVAPIRLSIVPLGASALTAPLLAASRRTLTVVDVLTERVRTADGMLSGVQLESAVREFRPDAVILLQGETADAEWAAAAGTLVGLVNDNVLGLIIIIANDAFQQQAAAALGERVDLRGIDPAEFSVGDIALALESELQTLYDARVTPQQIVAGVEPARFVSGLRATDLVTRFIARRREQQVVTIDVADGLALHWASPTQSEIVVRPELDVHRNVRAAFDLDLSAILARLPMQLSSEELSHWLLNRALRPRTIAEDPFDVAVERAVLVELARRVWTSMSASTASNVECIVAGRPFATASAPAALLALLDIIQPDPDAGVVEIVIDSDGLVRAAGAIGERSPAMAADVVENDLLNPAATVLVVRGGGTVGELAVRGQVRAANGEATRFTVPYGSLHRIPVDPTQPQSLTLICEQGYTIGGQQQFDEVTLGPDGMLRGGEHGVIIDARGRPLAARPGDSSAGAARVAGWLASLGGR